MGDVEDIHHLAQWPINGDIAQQHHSHLANWISSQILALANKKRDGKRSAVEPPSQTGRALRATARYTPRATGRQCHVRCRGAPPARHEASGKQESTTNQAPAARDGSSNDRRHTTSRWMILNKSRRSSWIERPWAAEVRCVLPASRELPRGWSTGPSRLC